MDERERERECEGERELEGEYRLLLLEGGVLERERPLFDSLPRSLESSLFFLLDFPDANAAARSAALSAAITALASAASLAATSLSAACVTARAAASVAFFNRDVSLSLRAPTCLSISSSVILTHEFEEANSQLPLVSNLSGANPIVA